MDFRIELFAQLPDPDHGHLSVIISGDQIVLEPGDGARFHLCRGSFLRIGDLIGRHEAASHAAAQAARD